MTGDGNRGGVPLWVLCCCGVLLWVMWWVVLLRCSLVGDVVGGVFLWVLWRVEILCRGRVA